MHAAVLRYFDHVARQGSIRKAAESLSVASSAVNRQILRLEDEIGVPLAGIAPPPHRTPPRLHAYALAGHLAYGLALEATHSATAPLPPASRP